MEIQKQFVGDWDQEKYKVHKRYLETEEKQVRLYHTKFTPPQPKYTMCIVHGFGEHSGRFYPIADYYAQKGFQVLLVDLRGFGYSGAPRGCAVVPKLQNDVIRLLKEAREDLPLFIYAHSLGGMTVLKLLLDRPELKISGCIITSPLLGFPKDRELPWIKIQIMKLIGDQMEDFVINSMVNPTSLTKNSKYLHSIFQDRLMIPFLSIKMAKSIIESAENVMSRKQDFQYPIIIFHGKADSVTNFQDSKKFVFSKVSPYKQIHLFENGFHQLQHDVEKDQLLKLSMNFIQSLPKKIAFGAINIKPIQLKSHTSKKYLYILISIIFLLIVYLKKFRNFSFIAALRQAFNQQ